MKLFDKTHLIISIITFAVIFFMNYIGNTQQDSLYTALMNAAAGVIGLSIGLFVLYKVKDKGDNQDFD